MMFVFYLLSALGLCGAATPSNMVWPLPRSVDTGSTTIPVSSQLKFVLDKSISSPTLEKAFERYTKLSFPHASAATAGLSTVTVSVATPNESHPQLDTDESYSLSVSGSTASIAAKTIYGAMHGLESFSQLVVFDFDTGAYTIPNGPWTIHDSPRFPHRGLMMDTARHFQPLDSIRGILRSLPFSKINVLHWHMSDTQSFPLQSLTRPNLWKGAWSSHERYMQADVAAIVEEARELGVRVIVEFDTPGHAASFCAGYPEVCPSASCQQPLNVANDETFALLTDLFGEMTGKKSSAPGAPSGLFPDDFIHLGGDEVDTSCWTKTPSVQQWLTKTNRTADEAYAYFAQKVSNIVIAQGRRPIQWSEVYDHFKTELDKKTIVHIWKSVTNVTEVVANGYDVLLNVGYDAKSWYLDNLNVKWDAVYSMEPCTGVPDNLCNKILGGHGEMWGETVDASDLEQTVWPREAAIGERLWSDRSIDDVDAAHPRLLAFRCLLNRRGVKAAPVNNANARSAPPGPGSCYNQ